MIRQIDIEKEPEKLNPWVAKSIEFFQKKAYLDNILSIYPFTQSPSTDLDSSILREIIKAHNARDGRALINILKDRGRFPYEDPIWYLLANVKGCLKKNPRQIGRILDILYSMTADETIARIIAPPKLNTQAGPMFRAWLENKFHFVTITDFQNSIRNIVLLRASEEEGKNFVQHILHQKVEKRPDLIAKVKNQYVIGEAKWIGQPGGNQEKQVQEVLKFCKNQRGSVKRVGIVDGFPWAIYNTNGAVINNKENVLIQESEYDMVSALLLNKYLNSLF